MKVRKMTNLTEKSVINCSQRFKDLIRQVCKKTSFTVVKRFKDCTPKLGISGLVEEAFQLREFDIMGDYTNRIEQLRRLSVNWTTNVGQLTKMLAGESLEAQGKVVQMTPFLEAYIKACEPLQAFIKELSERHYKMERIELPEAAEIRSESQNMAFETKITFMTSSSTKDYLREQGRIRETCAEIIATAAVYQKNLDISENEEQKLNLIKENFLSLNSLTTKLNSQRFKDEEIDLLSAAKTLKALIISAQSVVTK